MIGEYSFGSITIDGRTDDADGLIDPERIDDRCWRKGSHRLRLAGLEGMREIHPSVLAIGTGDSGRLRIDPTARDSLQRQGIALVACDTARACAEFNRLKETQNVVAALHLTC